MGKAGCLTTLLFLGIVGGVGFFYFKGLHEGRWNDPKEFIECTMRTKRRETSSFYNSSLDEKTAEIERKVNSGEMSIEEAKEEIVNLYGPILGKEKTKKIMNIATDQNYSPQEATREIINEVPTGLPSPLDRFVKGIVNQTVEKATKDNEY